MIVVIFAILTEQQKMMLQKISTNTSIFFRRLLKKGEVLDRQHLRV